ncbi:MAG TPA: tryptophan 2,3-dioxygenase family protein [Bacteroidia bacterium]|nr:tryptophan 2,3-dioxygenase family protein [Bacteroidia bacterium]
MGEANLPDRSEILKKIEEKYQGLGQDAGNFLKGFSHIKALTYWDYIEVDTLLSLQRPRTDFPDEPIFIMYHQVTELLLKLIRHELQQVTDAEQIDTGFFRIKLERVNRYAGILTQSFSVMREGMDYDQYNEFRLTLAPASGFQSAQFRFVELMCTDVSLLLNHRVKGKFTNESDYDEMFNEMYWLDAGLDRKTGKKTQTLQHLLERYLDDFKRTAQKMKSHNLYQTFKKLDPSTNGYDELKTAMRNFDHTYNVVWPLAHLKTAEHYLGQKDKGGVKAATGGSEWQKYLHPSYQRRIFFPDLWTAEELETWGTF